MDDQLERFRDRALTFIVGASAGVLVAWLLRAGRSRGAKGGGADGAGGYGPASEEVRGRWAEAIEGVVGTLMTARERLLGDGDPLIDLDALRASLAVVSGSERVHLRDLGGGIVEALGEAPDAETVHRALDALRAGEGVSVVVNRIWTPASATERAADLSHSPRVSPDA
jgi:hypothetical protein